MFRQLARAALAATIGWAAASAAASAQTLAAQTLAARQLVQHTLRRLAFSAPPETVDQVLAIGLPAWVAQQQQWQNLDDSGSELETLPTALNANGSYPDPNIFERAVMQHMLLTPRQLQAKLELHWLDHFSVSLAKVGDPAVMYHYDQAIRANALGNFANLLSAVGQEAAMLIWLDNNYNAGSVPNENFAREAMQLYSTGIYQLNSDGSIITSGGQPVAAYVQNDVKGLAKAMTGYGVVFDTSNNNPQTRFSVQYFPGNHYSGTISYFGRRQPVPTNGTAIDYVMRQLAVRPETAPFQVKELLQRFVTENPSAQYISDITAVWQKTAQAPDQIAQVMAAIVNHPLFPSSYHSMPKQPAEYVLSGLRVVPGTLQSATNAVPGGSLLWELNGLGQELFYPATVFSFYRPGNLSTTVNTGTLLYRTSVTANITNASASSAYTDTYIDIATLRARIGSTEGTAIRDYLLDAFVDGGSSSLQSALTGFLGKTPDDNQILGAIWLLLNAPDYAVN